MVVGHPNRAHGMFGVYVESAVVMLLSGPQLPWITFWANCNRVFHLP